jgi:hypothetical protein
MAGYSTSMVSVKGSHAGVGSWLPLAREKDIDQADIAAESSSAQAMGRWSSP